jgi:hypothetical protein
MKTKLFSGILMFLFLNVSLFSQTKTGTLKVFSEMQGINVFLDEVRQENYQEIKGVTIGTHYIKVLNESGVKVYGNVVTINENSVTTVLVEASKDVAPAQVNVAQPPVEQQPAQVKQVQSAGKTGTLNIFSELTGISVYLDENKQGDDIKQLTGIPAGSHYLKVLKGGVSIFGELVTINEGQTTTVLVKNDGQVTEKIMESKVKEREEYNAKKIDILFSTNSVSKTAGSSTLFPGYYGYWGYSNSVTSTSQIADFKIIQGGIKEISDPTLAGLVNNTQILNAYAADNAIYYKTQKVSTIVMLSSLVPFTVMFIDMALKKPFLHTNPTGEGMNLQAVPAWEWTGVVFTLLIGWVGMKIGDKPQSSYIKNHYYRVDEAAKDAQTNNKKLKEKLGLPESYDVE